MGQTQAAAPLDEGTQGISGARSAPRPARVNGGNSLAPAIAASLLPPRTNPLPLADLFGNSNASGDGDWFNFLSGIASRRPLGN
jgi:hypothetical protein